ncbi:MAG: PQQ-dependent sugar dehydrogenase [Steroidobacteraceae bacterium]
MNIGTLLAVAALGAAVAVPCGAAQPALTAAQAGKAVFRAQCALCHSAEPNDNGGAQGPALQGLVGRTAGTAAGFSYTAALRNSRLTWDPATLERFLAAPTTVVPGTAMVIPVTQATERVELVAYFSELAAGTFVDGPPPRGFGPPPDMMRTVPPSSQGGTPDWKNDRPGRVHRIDLQHLPPPFETPSVVNFPRIIDKPANARPALPPGFEVGVFASGFSGPRTMRVAPNGDILLAETTAGRITLLRPAADGRTATPSVFAQGLIQPFGIAFYPAGPNPRWVYVAEFNRVVRYAYKPGQSVASGVPEIVVPQLAPSGGGHFTRDLAFSQDGRRLFVSVGSQSNVPEDMPEKTPAEIRAWEAAHGVGAAWGQEESRATVRVFEMGRDGPGPGRNFATGIRNCVALAVQPANGELWCTTNERDLIGDGLVPDYSTRVRQGEFYGWPWYYLGDHEDPRFKDARTDLRGKVAVPEVPFEAHSAATGFAFYPLRPSGRSAFPREYAGDAFAVLHGSWNRSQRTGYKVVRVPLKNGVPTGEYIDFMTGFIADGGDVWGRPASATVAPDGSLLVSDDAANVIYRVSYTGQLDARAGRP